MKCVNGGLDNVEWRVEVRLADFEVDDVFALALKGACFVQDFEGGFGAETRHAAGEAKLVLRGVFHDGKPRHYTLRVMEMGYGYDALRRGWSRREASQGGVMVLGRCDLGQDDNRAV